MGPYTGTMHAKMWVAWSFVPIPLREACSQLGVFAPWYHGACHVLSMAQKYSYCESDVTQPGQNTILVELHSRTQITWEKRITTKYTNRLYLLLKVTKASRERKRKSWKMRGKHCAVTALAVAFFLGCVLSAPMKDTRQMVRLHWMKMTFV